MTEPTIDPGADRARLGAQYDGPANLEKRSSIYAFQEPRYDLPGELVQLVRQSVALGGAAGRPARALDVGCGPGTYLDRLRAAGADVVMGLDLSAGMLSTAAHACPDARLVRGDGMRLPVASGCVALVLAPHMLYHLPDPRAGVAELRRVVRDDGTVVAVLNVEDHLAEFRQLLNEAADLRPNVPWVGDRCNVAHRPWFDELFGRVAVHSFPGALTLTDVEPLVAYAESVRDFYDALLDDPWEDVMARFRHLAERRLREDGSITIRTGAAMIVCRP